MDGSADSGRLLGLETELLLLDDRGDLSNRAGEIVSHSGNTGNIVPEFCQAIVETNPPPSTSIRQLETNLHAELNAVRSIVELLGIAEVPLSEIGPDNQAQRNLDSRRYALFEEVMGVAHCDMERSFCGTHLHVDWIHPRTTGEYSAATTMGLLR
jgi:gamma-glutamyl:cysteine ligase YbdK (ATP-grasp superfamily)